jgi:hypothetical protein
MTVTNVMRYNCYSVTEEKENMNTVEAQDWSVRNTQKLTITNTKALGWVTKVNQGLFKYQGQVTYNKDGQYIATDFAARTLKEAKEMFNNLSD